MKLKNGTPPAYTYYRVGWSVFHSVIVGTLFALLTVCFIRDGQGPRAISTTWAGLSEIQQGFASLIPFPWEETDKKVILTPSPSIVRERQLEPLPCVRPPLSDGTPWETKSRTLRSFPADTPRPKHIGWFSDTRDTYRLSVWRDSKGIFGEMSYPVLDADSPTSRLYDAHFDEKSGALSFRAELGLGELFFSGTLSSNAIEGTLRDESFANDVVMFRLADDGNFERDRYVSRTQYYCEMVLFNRN